MKKFLSAFAALFRAYGTLCFASNYAAEHVVSDLVNDDADDSFPPDMSELLAFGLIIVCFVVSSALLLLLTLNVANWFNDLEALWAVRQVNPWIISAVFWPWWVTVSVGLFAGPFIGCLWGHSINRMS